MDKETAQIENKPFLNTGDVAKLFGRSREWVYLRCRNGDMPCSKVAGSFYFTLQDLNAWLKNKKVR